MGKVENIELQVGQLAPDELRAFREWFEQFDADAWDRQFESGVRNGKSDRLAERAMQQFDAGQAMEL